MDNQHRKISGYRELSEAEIDLMNEAKTLEAACNRLVDKLRGTPEIDQRQVSIAQTDFESAFMRTVRSIARPARLVVEDEETNHG
jgi:hypothetical protein